jgi:Sugar-transfer associated ATP-grasp
MSNAKAFIGRLMRGLRQLWYRDIWHLWPSAPMNWRYVLPGQSDAVRLHRKLWWHSHYKLPGLLWLPLECVRWLHWRVWAGPRRLQAAAACYGTEVESRFGIPVNEQRSRIGYWAKAWCIDPYMAYDWQLYRSDADGLTVIYDSQTSAYHALQNRKTGATKADHRLLGDKIALAELLTARGIAMVETVRVSRGDWQDIDAVLLRHPKLFCKLRSGNQAESAFSVWQGQHGIQGLAHDGTDLPDERAIRKAWQVLTSKGDVLIQPLLLNHSNLEKASPSGVAITLRLVTRSAPEGISTWWAELQVPGDVPLQGRRGFWRFPVSIADGAVSVLSREWFLKQAWQDEHDALWPLLSAANHVPYWSGICSDSLKAHQALPKVWAIAWDWVITPNGAVLLEGNGGWGLCEIQQQGVELGSLTL